MRLVLDTATRHIVVALGEATGVAASVVREVVPGRGTPLLALIEEASAEAGVTLDGLEAIGVGTGPGSFTGLRAGLATAKTLCWLRGLPIVALPTDETIRRAATLADPTLAAPAAVVLPAGARDHYVALPGADAVLAPPAADLAALVAGAPAVALDVAPAAPRDAFVAAVMDAGHPDPVALGTAALRHLPAALLALFHERLTSGALADVATLVPSYVALPRGIDEVPVEGGTTVRDTTRDTAWSPTHP